MILGFSALQRTGLRDGLLAFYKLGDTSDSSGNGNVLTNIGGVTFASGKIGNAAVFDGSNYLNTGVSIDSSLAFSIACWVYFEEVQGNNNVIFGSHLTDGIGNETAMLFGYEDENQYASLNTADDGYVQLDGPPLTLNGWEHLGFTYSGSIAKMYVDGTLVAQEACSGAVNAQPLIRLGADSDGGSNFIGSIDAAGIWNRALSDEEINVLYNNGTGRELP